MYGKIINSIENYNNKDFFVSFCFGVKIGKFVEIVS